MLIRISRCLFGLAMLMITGGFMINTILRNSNFYRDVNLLKSCTLDIYSNCDGCAIDCNSNNGIADESLIVTKNLNKLDHSLSNPALLTTPCDNQQSPYKVQLVTIIREKIISWRSPRGEEGELVREITAGMVAAIATIPTSIAYASICGLNPLLGIWSSVFIGGGVALIGGSPGLIAGVAGVVAVPITRIVTSHGLEYMNAACLLAALFECVFGLLKLGNLIEYVTKPVITGFLNAFGFFLLRTQFNVFLNLPSNQLRFAIQTASLCAGAIYASPQFVQAVPPSLVGLIISSLVTVFLKWPTTTISDVAGKLTFKGGLSSLPKFVGLPSVPYTLETLRIITPTATAVAFIAVLITLLANKVACDRYRCLVSLYEEADQNRASIGISLGTVMSALCGGFAGCGLIPNTLLNGKSGGEGYASSYSYSFFVAASVIFLAPIIGMIPVAALAGLMGTVAWNTIDWSENKKMLINAKNSPKDFVNIFAMLITTIICYKFDMALGLLAGIITTQSWQFLNTIKTMIPANVSKYLM